MKILSLNIWGGKVHDPLIAFVQKYADSIDVFCLQEVFSSPSERIESTGAHHSILENLRQVLPHHAAYFFPAQDGPGMDAAIYPDMQYGLVIFVANHLSPVQIGDVFVYGSRNSYAPDTGFTSLPRNMAYASFKSDDRQLTICNLHGLWNGQGKGDSSDRLAQSRKVQRFLQTTSGEVVLCGDFNLLPNTQSLRLLEKGLTNLIAKHGITSTRTSLYSKELRLADYMLVSPTLNVNHFAVLPDEVSDHSPLLIDVAF